MCATAPSLDMWVPVEFGLLLNEKISWLEFDKVGMILLMLFLTVCAIEYFSRYLASLVRGRRRIKKEHADCWFCFLPLYLLFVR